MKKTIMMSLLSLFVTIASFGQITTSTISGVVKSEKGEKTMGLLDIIWKKIKKPIT